MHTVYRCATVSSLGYVQATLVGNFCSQYVAYLEICCVRHRTKVEVEKGYSHEIESEWIFYCHPIKLFSKWQIIIFYSIRSTATATVAVVRTKSHASCIRCASDKNAFSTFMEIFMLAQNENTKQCKYRLNGLSDLYLWHSQFVLLCSLFAIIWPGFYRLGLLCVIVAVAIWIIWDEYAIKANEYNRDTMKIQMQIADYYRISIRRVVVVVFC